MIRPSDLLNRDDWAFGVDDHGQASHVVWTFFSPREEDMADAFARLRLEVKLVKDMLRRRNGAAIGQAEEG